MDLNRAAKAVAIPSAPKSFARYEMSGGSLFTGAAAVAVPADDAVAGIAVAETVEDAMGPPMIGGWLPLVTVLAEDWITAPVEGRACPAGSARPRQHRIDLPV
ncbi:hypothetical protein, partial [Paraburkholderia fungorum]|uniref:hypothetical protein n=1 Tax=Paraburkholderia fungorum TaxID=134537 RepID=UPI001C922C2F